MTPYAEAGRIVQASVPMGPPSFVRSCSYGGRADIPDQQVLVSSVDLDHHISHGLSFVDRTFGSRFTSGSFEPLAFFSTERAGAPWVALL